MNLKSVIQILLIITILIVIFLFFFKYFYVEDKTSEIIIEEKKEEIISDEKTENIIEDLRFENTDINGNKFIINSKYGEINIDNLDILSLTNVTGIIFLVGKSPIYIASDFAKYNKKNFNTSFYSNVTVDYEENLIKSDNFDISLDSNIASINGNVIFNNKKVETKADNIVFDILKQDLTINMFDKDENIKINVK